MKKLISLLLSSFYSFGIFCLPMGDFSSLTDIPAMYKHCKATEDKDMTPVDFVTDHLINVDCIFDKHDNGDEQKPHTPVQFHHQQLQNSFITQIFKITETGISNIKVLPPGYEERNYFSNFYHTVFRPPIV